MPITQYVLQTAVMKTSTSAGSGVASPHFDAQVADFSGYRLPLSNPEIPIDTSPGVDEPVGFVGHWDQDHRLTGTDGNESLDLRRYGSDYLVNMGGGNDTVYGGRGDDSVRGGTGNDTLYGGQGNDQITGGADNDYIDGGYGEDKLYGEAGNDVVHGYVGDDYVSGGTGHDKLFGEAGVDHLVGGHGNDRMDGGTGSDKLNGGRGGDVMTGGSGADTFIYESVQDSLKLHGLYDTITDFKQGVDKLDFSKIDANESVAGNQSFQMVTYGGPNQALSAGQMTVHFDYEIGRTIIEANVDGDASNEFYLELDGNVVPNSGDILV